MNNVILITGIIGIAAGFAGFYTLGSVSFAIGILAIGFEMFGRRIMTAENRARDIFYGRSPSTVKSSEYVQAACKKYGGCGEVILTALLDYAVKEEGLVSDGSFG